MRIVIVGNGKVGITLTARLINEGHEVTIIDEDPNVLKFITEQYDVLAINGNGASMQVLREAKTGSAELLIAVTASDEINILSCMTARAMGCKHTIARVRNTEYTEQLNVLKDTLGLSMVINPEMSVSREIFNTIQFPSFISRETFLHGRVELVSLILRGNNPLIGKKLSQIPHDKKFQVIICAVERGSDLFIPTGDFLLAEGDRIHVTAEAKSLASFVKYMGIQTARVRDVVLIGGSKIAVHLGTQLVNSGVNVTVVEIDPERCDELAQLLPHANIINADISTAGVMEEEIIGQHDAAVFLLGIDEANIILSLHATRLGVKKVISKVDRVDYQSIVDIIQDETIISPRLHSCNAIIRYVRAMSNARSMDYIRAVYRLVNDRAEAIELSVPFDAPHLDDTLAELPLRRNVIIATIQRGSRVFFPTGSDSINAGDTIIVFTTSQNKISSFSDLLDI
ncbi:MAG: Trk system potassium transporter TrkA [Clostridia bacterium]|nr:Trk system potassium transporter TrkA [Clostridia bacterium]